MFICLSPFLYVSCKKGEDDPKFSLLTRKARVAGDWHFQEGTINVGTKDSKGSYSALSYKLEQSKYSVDYIGKGAHFEYGFDLSVEFTKDGHVTIHQKMDTLNIETNGTWDFEGKVGKYKNKESINIQLGSFTGVSYFYRTFNKGQTNFSYRIKELRNKKMVLVCEEEMASLTENAGIYITAEYTFKQ
jgi:hypothetical protein